MGRPVVVGDLDGQAGGGQTRFKPEGLTAQRQTRPEGGGYLKPVCTGRITACVRDHHLRGLRNSQ